MRAERISLLAEVKGKLEKSGYAMLVNYTGLSVEQLTELRSALKSVNGNLMITKNTTIKRAVTDLGWDCSSCVFEGPTGILFGSGDPTSAVKALKNFRKDKELPALKFGWLGGSLLSKSEAEALADVPPREVLLGRVVGTIAAPMTGLVGVMKQKISSIVYVLKAIEEKKR